MYINLGRPLSRGSKIDVTMEFEILIPRMLGHFGYDSDGDYLVAHCFPILCGYQKDRLIDWEYHSNSEFFSNFSYYDITIELPKDFKAVSSGEISKESETDSTFIWHARADTVIDFAFVCGAGMLEYESEFNGVTLKYLIKEKHEESYLVVDSTVKNSLQFCGDYLYPYPYKTFSFADAGFTNAGLELPGLIVAGFFGSDKAFSANLLKKTIAHETAHQWFYATIATNEFEEPWLDEGFASNIEFKISREYGFEEFPFLFSNYQISDRTMRRLFALAEEARYPINLKSWDYPDWQSYIAAVYGRAWMVLLALENAIGDSAFAEALKIFAGDYRFRHPDQEDLIESLSNSSSKDLAGFVEMFIDGTSRVDYAVESMEFEKNENEGDSGGSEYIVHVDVVRKYDGILPQVIVLGLEDGTEIYENWDGKERFKRITFKANSVPLYASLDRKISYAIDENRNNNTVYRKGHVTRMISFEWDAIFIIEFLASILL